MVGDLMEVILYVGDMPEAVSFYRDRLGLRIAYPQCEDYRSEYWVVFETGSCKLCLHGGGERRQGQDTAKVVFRVPDIQTARAQLVDHGVALGARGRRLRRPGGARTICSWPLTDSRDR